MRTIDFIYANEWEILSRYGFNRTGNKHIDCPICQSKKKFRLTEYNGKSSWICTCGNGSVVDLIMEVHGRSYQELMSEIERDYNLQTMKGEPKREAIKLPSVPKIATIKGTSVEKYLNSRGITSLPQKHLGIAQGQYHSQTGKSYDAMCSIATDYAFNAALVHRTFLDDGAKIESTAKKLEKLKDSQNIAVRMFDSDTCIGIGEGIESALSASQIYSVPTWAALNTAFLKKFRAPLGVKTLIVFADRDRHGAGLAAAFACANSNLMCKNDVNRAFVKWAEAGDFNDHLIEPKRVFEEPLTR